MDAIAQLDDAGKALRILYSSTDRVAGQGLLAASGAVCFPKSKPGPSGWPVIAWAHGTTGTSDECAPSRKARPDRDATYLNTWLREGYVVVAADYQGLGIAGPHPYLHARAQACSGFDAERTVLGMDGVSNRVAIVGQSQGAGAAFATASYAQRYAPDIDLRGTLATGTPNLGRPDPTPVPADRVDTGLAYVIYAAATVQLLNPASADLDLFTSNELPAFKHSARACVWEMFDQIRKERLTSQSTLVPGAMLKMLRAAGPSIRYPTLKLSKPIFTGIGGADIDVSTAQQIQLSDDACKAGTDVVKHVYQGLHHSETVNASLPDSMPFVLALFAGISAVSTCGT